MYEDDENDDPLMNDNSLMPPTTIKVLPDDLALTATEALSPMEKNRLMKRIMSDLRVGKMNVFTIASKYVNEEEDPRYTYSAITELINEAFLEMAKIIADTPMEIHQLHYMNVLDNALGVSDEISNNPKQKGHIRLSAARHGANFATERLQFALQVKNAKTEEQKLMLLKETHETTLEHGDDDQIEKILKEAAKYG